MTSPGPTLDSEGVSIHDTASRDVGTRSMGVLPDGVAPHAVGTYRQGMPEVRPYRFGHSPVWARLAIERINREMDL